MKLATILLLTFLSLPSFAGGCHTIPDMIGYEYIALVEITLVKKSELYNYENHCFSLSVPPPLLFHEIEVETIRQYKGSIQCELIVLGGNKKYGLGMTSADLHMSVGEQWLIFGQPFKNKIRTGYCDLTIKLKNINDEVDYQYKKGLQTLAEVNEKFGILPILDKDGLYIEKYPNGNTSLKECYVDGKLEDKRIAYYANGQVMLMEYYKNGLLNGISKWYYKDGTPKRICEFRAGKMICDCTYFWGNGIKQITHFYTENGEFLGSYKFDWKGKQITPEL